MNIHDFRRIALSLEGAEESAHMGSPDFRVGGRIFATLAGRKTRLRQHHDPPQNSKLPSSKNYPKFSSP
jgi:hypothetical protein